MTDLVPITSLPEAARFQRSFGALTIAENTGLALASLALRRRATPPEPMGLALPGPGAWTSGRRVAAFWTGPGQWMIEAEGRADENFAAQLAAEAPGCSITDQTDGWVAFEMESYSGGAPMRMLMEKLVNLDAQSFVPGSATRTGLHHMSVFAIRRTETRLAIIGMRSLAGALLHVLGTAALRQERGNA